MSYLKDAGIGAGIHYPIPLHLQKAYVSLNYSPGDLPVAETVATEIVSLPMFPQLSDVQQMTVAKRIHAFLRNGNGDQGAVEETLVAQEESSS
jgi:dTDP-4-amino-4,6-dideoxygalactose transaminase